MKRTPLKRKTRIRPVSEKRRQQQRNMAQVGRKDRPRTATRVKEVVRNAGSSPALCPTPVTTSTASPERGASLHKTGLLASRTYCRWHATERCQLAGIAGHRAEPHDAGDPHHVASRGAHGRQDIFVVGVCAEGHREAHGGLISRRDLAAAGFDGLVAFIERASPETKRAALAEMFGLREALSW